MDGYASSKSVIALIPARAGSVRIPGKNRRLLAGHPLIAYTIAAAKQSGIFDAIIVSTDSDLTAELAIQYGACVHGRKPEHATSESPDIEWVRDFFSHGYPAENFSILRPTSPFRTAATIQRAWNLFRDSGADSLRAMEPWNGPHPGKMWTYSNVTLRISPILSGWTAHAPYHSSPTQSLMPVARQNASLEMARVGVLSGIVPTIAGDDVLPFWTIEPEGVDLNTPEDWAKAEAKIASGEWRLPDVS